MFYCKGCQEKNGYPKGFSLSYGPCECCEKVAYCFDVPSKFLGPPPDPERVAALHRLENELARDGK